MCSETASSPTRKPARSVMRRRRRSAGSSAHARASGVRSMASGSHCRRATSLEKKSGQKLRFGRTKCPATVRSQNCFSGIGAKEYPPAPAYHERVGADGRVRLSRDEAAGGRLNRPWFRGSRELAIALAGGGDQQGDARRAPGGNPPPPAPPGG